MTSLLLSKDFCSFASASALLRNSSKPRPRKCRILHRSFSILNGSSSHFIDRHCVSIAKLPIASATSSASLDYRSLLTDSISHNERLHRSIVALAADKRRNFRITAAILDVVIGYLDDADQLSVDDADFLFRCCGRLTPAAPVQKRIQYLKTIWNSLPRLGLVHDLTAYVRLQQMLLQNRQMFSASGFLERVRKAGYEPNGYLYLGSVIRCAMDEQPNFDEINQYVEAIRKLSSDKQILIKTRGALITAHAMAKDTEKLRVLLEQAKVEDAAVGGTVNMNHFYFSRASVASQRGDTMTMFKMIDQARRENAALSDFQLLYLARWLARVNRQDSVLRVLNYMPKQENWIYRTLPFVLTLISDGHYVTALTILQRSAAASAVVAHPSAIPSPDPSSTDESVELLPKSENVYHFLLDLFYLKLPTPQIIAFCRRLVDCGYTEDAFQLAAVAAIDAKREDIAQKMLEEATERLSTPQLRSTKSPEGDTNVSPLQPRHFYTALRTRSLLGDLDSVLDLLKRMESEIGSAGVRALANFVLRYFYSPVLDANTILSVFGVFCSRSVLLTAAICVCLREGDGEKARKFLYRFPKANIIWRHRELVMAMCHYYQKTYDMQVIIDILQRIDEICKERKLIGKDDGIDHASACAQAVYYGLNQKLCKPEMDEFRATLEREGIVVRDHTEDIRTDQTSS